MGCLESRSEKVDNQSKESEKKQASDNILEIKLYTNAELSLNLHGFPSENLVTTLRRYSYSKEITEKNLVKAFKIMGIMFEESIEFYKLFRLETICYKEAIMYNAQKMCTLFILFGKYQTIEKSSLIFKNYDLLGENILSQEDINTMIQDILWIILVAIPTFTLQQYPNKAVLIKQFESFHKAKPEILIEFKSKLVHRSQKNITFKEFSEKASKSEFMKIFKPFDIRNYALKRQNFIICPKDLKKFYTQTTEESTGNSAFETNKCLKLDVPNDQNNHKANFESAPQVKKFKKTSKK